MAASMWNTTGIWSDGGFSPPPVASCSYDCYEIEEVDVYNLKLALQVIQTSHSTGLGLSSEQYTLSRFLYKANNQQRHWRWYQMLKKIHKCLNRLQANNPVKFMEDAIGCCQINRNQTGSGSITIHLPARQMLEYILVKLMGQAKLCAYILAMAEKVYVFVVQNIASGQFLAHNTIYASIVSRIWVMMHAALREILPWYSTLRPWVDKLKATSMQWMPAGEVLPQCLYEWLRPDYDPEAYSSAIGPSSKKTSSSLLDNMFANSNPSTPEAARSDSTTGGASHSKEVTMAPSIAPSMDLGEPVAAENRKRKRADRDDLQEPAVKKSLPEIGSWTPKIAPGRQVDKTANVQPEMYLKKSSFSCEIQHTEDVRLGQLKRKQSKGILRHFKQRLKGEPKQTKLAGDPERGTNREAKVSGGEPEGGQRTWRTNLKKSLKKKFEKLIKNPSADSHRRNADLWMEEVDPVDEELLVGGSSASLSSSEVVHDRRKLKGVRKVTRETKKSATDFNSVRQGQVEQSSKEKMEKAEGFPKHSRLPKKYKKRQEVGENRLEPEESTAPPVAYDTEHFILGSYPSETGQTKSRKKFKKKAQNSMKSNQVSSTSEGRYPQISEEMSSEKIGRTVEYKKPSGGKKSQEMPDGKIFHTSPPKTLPQNQTKTKKKAVKRKREETESCGFKGLFKKSKKPKSESLLVCDLGEMPGRERVKSNNQPQSEIDNIFALLE